MASDQTDLIREADDLLDGITPGPWRRPDQLLGLRNGGIFAEGGKEVVIIAHSRPGDADGEFIAAAPDLVRRLRDALGMSERQVRSKRDQIDAMTEVGERIARERDELRAALAEANATTAALREREETIGHIAEVERFKAVEATRELVEAGEAIERVRKIVDDPTLKDYAALAAIRRAIEGEQ